MLIAVLNYYLIIFFMNVVNISSTMMRYYKIVNGQLFYDKLIYDDR